MPIGQAKFGLLGGVVDPGKLELIECSPKLFCKGNYLVEPEVGNFYLFPNYLFHTVYPFTDSDEERRSVSFNAKIDDDAAKI